MIPFDEIDARLKSLGKDRPWLVKTSGRKEGSVRASLAPNAAKKQRSPLIQKALTDAIEREEAKQGIGVPQISGVFEIRQTPEQSDRADRASRVVSADSFADFCLQAIQHRANEILNHGIDPCIIRPPAVKPAPLTLVEPLAIAPGNSLASIQP